MTHTAPQGLPPLPKPDTHCLDDDTQRDVWSYSAELVKSCAREALVAQAATIEAICKIIECAGPEAADEIADLLGYPSVEWPSDQAASVEPVGEVMEGAQTVGFGRKEIQKFAQFDQSLPVGTKLYASAPPSPASVPADASAPIWNSIQIASWIGSQLMHEPAMFERAVVCKFVRSLGRHPTLLKHSPHPQAVAEGAGDGLRQTLIDVGRVIAWQCFGDCRAYDEFGPGSLRGLHEMDAEIRAALATPQPEPEWSPAYTRGPARQSAPVAAVPALVPLSVLQYNQIPELCQIRPSLYESVVRAIEAAIAKINGLTVGDGAQPIKDTP